MDSLDVLNSYAPGNLPNGMIGLDTPAGQALRNETSVINDLVIDRFSNQVNRKYCGPASLALLINAMNVAYRIKYYAVTHGSDEEKELFNSLANGGVRVDENDIVNSPKVRSFFQSIHVSENGMTLQQLANVSMHLGFGVNTYFAFGENNLLSEANKKKLLMEVEQNSDEFMFNNAGEFREFAKDFIGRIMTGLIINYNMSELGYKGFTGHFSLLAGYHEESDRFLVMDVWPDTPPAWVKTEHLYKAMLTVDGDSGFPRGLLHIHELI